MLITPPAARLLVLVPEGDLPVVELAQRIWQLAREAGAAVLLVGLAGSAERETQARQALAVLQSHTQFEAVAVSTRVSPAPDWLTAVRQLRRPGDQVVVLADQPVAAGRWGLARQPLAQALVEQLHVSACVITDLPLAPPEPRWAALARWGVSLLVIALFFAVLAGLPAALPASAVPAAQIVAVIIEFSVLARLQQSRP